MSNDPFPPSTPPLETSHPPEDLSNSTFVAKSLMWILWVVVIFAIMTLFLYAYTIDPAKDHWKIDTVVAGVLAFLVPISLLLMFLIIKKVKKAWVEFVVYFFGIFTNFVIISCAFFAVMSGDFLLLTVGSFLVLLYCPIFTRRAKNAGLIK